MKIAFIIPSLANKGPILVVKDITDYLVDGGLECVVYYFDEIPEIEFRCKVERINFFKPIDFSEFNIVHSHMFRPDLYVNIWRRSKHARTKFISTVHMSLYQDILYAYGRLKAFFTPKIWLHLWRKMDLLIVLTAAAKKEYQQLNANKRLIIINNGRNIDLSVDISNEDKLFFQRLKEKKHIILGTVASFNRRKGLEQIFELLKYETTLYFVIVGDGPEKKNLMTMAAAMEMQDRLFFMGTKKNGFAYMKYFDIYALPSRSEGLPLALIEAVASKTPVICSSIEVFQEIFTEEEVAFFKLDNSVSLAEAYCRVTKNGSQMAEKAYQKYIEKFSATKMAHQHLELYKTLL